MEPGSISFFFSQCLITFVCLTISFRAAIESTIDVHNVTFME